jgi:replication factor C subunit 2/4
MLIVPWIEKYRPHKIKDIVIDKIIMKELNQILENKCINNIIITGTPGVGKTTTVKCFANELYGPYYDRYVLEINASDDRGIKIHTDIINFCKTKICYKTADLGKYATHKLIIMDEADNITNKAQRLINNMMEQFKTTTKFIFTCNSSNKIIHSLQSKCKIIRYPRLNDEHIIHRLKYICAQEKLEYENNALSLIAQISTGDMRSAINILNITFNKYNFINKKNILDIYNIPHPDRLKEILLKCISGEINDVINNIISMKNDGFCGKDIIVCMFYTLKHEMCNDINEDTRIKFIDIISHTVYSISNGTDTNLQLYNCLLQLLTVKKKI